MKPDDLGLHRGVLAWVREVPESYERATVAERPLEAIDVARARRQHEHYVAALRSAGARVARVPGVPELPDSCFVEDQAVILDDCFLLPRSAHPVRALEQEGVAAELQAVEGLEPVWMDAPGTLDGGDVLRVDDELFIGLSARTNRSGAEQLAALARRVGLRPHVLAVGGGALHLKSLCGTPRPGTVLLAEGSLDPTVFSSFEVKTVPAEEHYAANVLGLNGHVLVSAGHPRTAELLSGLGLELHLLETTEFRKGDGALTCLSLLWQR